MDDASEAVGKVARQVLAEVSVPEWSLLQQQEWIGVGVEPALGGHGGTLAEVAAIGRAIGSTAVEMPILEVIAAPMVAGLNGNSEFATAIIKGEVRSLLMPSLLVVNEQNVVDIPWMDGPETLLAVARVDSELRLSAIPVDAVAQGVGSGLAGDEMLHVSCSPKTVETHLLPGSLDGSAARKLIATLTAARLVGAMETVHGMTVKYADERSQFGRRLASFQALAHSVVRQAGAVQLSRSALQAALDCEDCSEPIAISARVVANVAVNEVVQVGHQVHGAIGVTREHELHKFTLRLRVWRDCFGTARQWETIMGTIASSYPSAFWEATTPESCL